MEEPAQEEIGLADRKPKRSSLSNENSLCPPFPVLHRFLFRKVIRVKETEQNLGFVSGQPPSLMRLQRPMLGEGGSMFHDRPLEGSLEQSRPPRHLSPETGLHKV